MGRTPDAATATLPTDALRGKRVLAISAIGAPAAFGAQLAAAGALVESAAYPDHHTFDARDIEQLSSRAALAEIACCTLKDAVKLGPRWPREAPPLWYLSQAVEVERGNAVVQEALRRLVPAATP